jgi:hypothetical protein
MIRQGRLVLDIGQESKLLKEGHQARVHSDQMVLVMARHEAGPVFQSLSRAIFSQAKAKGDYQA